VAGNVQWSSGAHPGARVLERALAGRRGAVFYTGSATSVRFDQAASRCASNRNGVLGGVIARCRARWPRLACECHELCRGHLLEVPVAVLQYWLWIRHTSCHSALTGIAGVPPPPPQRSFRVSAGIFEGGRRPGWRAHWAQAPNEPFQRGLGSCPAPSNLRSKRARTAVPLRQPRPLSRLEH